MNDDRDPAREFGTLQLLQAYERAIDERPWTKNIISSIADTRGVIVSVNPKFCDLEVASRSRKVFRVPHHHEVDARPRRYCSSFGRSFSGGAVSAAFLGHALRQLSPAIGTSAAMEASMPRPGAAP